MSIEKKIDELIQALERNTSVLQSVNTKVHVHMPNEGAGSFIESLGADKKTIDPVEPEKVDNRPSSATVEEKTVLKYEDMVTAFRQFIGKHGRDRAAEVLTSFGITGKLTQDQLPEDKYQSFLEALK